MWCEKVVLVEACETCNLMDIVIANLSGYDCNIRISQTLKISQSYMFGFCYIS